MGLIATAGLDDLPRNLRSTVAVAPASLSGDRAAFEKNRQAVERALQSDPDLFQNEAKSLRDRLEQDRIRLDNAAAALTVAQQSAKPNRRSDAEKVERALREFDTLRHEPVADSDSVKTRVEKAIYNKQHPFDQEAAIAPVRKAMVDWPEKKSDLNARLDAVNDPESAANLDALAAQLYISWDKLLLSVDRDREKIRLVETVNGTTTNVERTESRSFGVGRESEGLVIEHKPAGKYDSESERIPQPAGYAYIAPPGQSNHYGHWADGVWHWLPAYFLMSQMLHASRTAPQVSTRDYHSWYEHSPRTVPPPVMRGQAPRMPEAPRAWRSPGSQQSSSGWWKERPKPSWGERSFDSSKYKSRGSFGGSKYQSRGTFRSFPRGRR